MRSFSSLSALTYLVEKAAEWAQEMRFFNLIHNSTCQHCSAMREQCGEEAGGGVVGWALGRSLGRSRVAALANARSICMSALAQL